jgi:hypothetical protein
MAYAGKAFDHLGIIFAYGAERGWTLSCGMPGAGQAGTGGKSDDVLTRRAWPTAAQTAIVGALPPHITLCQCPPGRPAPPVGSPTPGTSSGEYG